LKLAQTRLQQLGPYPFERLSALFSGPSQNSQLEPIDAGAGEPRLPLPAFVQPTLDEHIGGFSRYPSTRGDIGLRQAIARWLERRYNLNGIDPNRNVLTANGTREALFAAAHALINPEADEKPYVLMPNPMYQIYLGAAVTAGGIPYLLPCEAENGFEPRLETVPEDVWRRTALVYVCSPSNPTGWVAEAAYFEHLLKLADEHDFYVLSDECYSEIYWQTPPAGLLEVAAGLGRSDFERCLVFNSLSKRSALPGMRSGLIAGDAELIERFAKLRSYTGSATPLPLQHVAIQAWQDEEHVQQHLTGYRASLRAFFDEYGTENIPSGSFFCWLPVENDEAFAVAAYEQQAVTILPGNYLGATNDQSYNPGSGYVRVALVDGPEKAAELARRLKAVKA